MSFLTSPTRLNEVLIDSDQTWVSRKSLKVPSGATQSVAGDLDASEGFFFPSQTDSGSAALSIRSGEFLVGEVSGTSSVLQFRSGNTVHQFVASGTSVI